MTVQDVIFTGAWLLAAALLTLYTIGLILDVIL